MRRGDAVRGCVWVFSCCFRFSSSSRSFWSRASSASCTRAAGDEEEIRGEEACTDDAGTMCGDDAGTVRGDDGTCGDTEGDPCDGTGDVEAGEGDKGVVRVDPELFFKSSFTS